MQRGQSPPSRWTLFLGWRRSSLPWNRGSRMPSCSTLRLPLQRTSYWRDKEKQLRDEEKQLRDEKNLLLQLLLQLKGASTVCPTFERVKELLDGFWDRVLESYSTTMLPPQDLKGTFALCKVPVCLRAPRTEGVPSHPSLLWQGLDEISHFTETVLRSTRVPEPPLTIFLDVSGAGKTRTLYEIGRQQQCIYLTGVPVGGSGHAVEGSGDLLAVAAALQRLYPGEGSITDFTLQCCLKALLLCRFFIMRKSEEMLNPMQNITWLYTQVMHRHIGYPFGDPWKYLTEQLLSEIISVQDINAWHDVFTHGLSLFKKNWQGPVIVDECQEVHRYLSNRFDSPTAGACTQSMMDKLPMALSDSTNFAKSAFYLAGTGRALLEIATETLKNRLPVKVWTSFGGFYSEDALRQYADRVLKDTSKFDFARILKLYHGRYRFFVTALERYIATDDPSLDATDYVIQFGDQMRGGSPANDGAESTVKGLSRTIFDDVIRFFEKGVVTEDVSKARQLLEDMVALHFFGWQKLAVVNPSLSLMEFGLARIVKEPKAGAVTWLEAGKEGVFGIAASESAYKVVQIEEPLVCKGCWHYFVSKQKLAEIQRNLVVSKGEGSHSRVDEVYEVAVAEMIGRFFDGKAPAAMLPSWYKDQHYNSGIADVYRQTAKLVVPKVVGVKVVGHMTKEYRLCHWIDDVVAGAHTFPSFLYTGGDNTFGPDVLFFLEVEINQSRVLLPCLVQVKTHATMHMAELRDAFDTLDLGQLFLHKKLGNSGEPKVNCRIDEEGAISLRELAKDGCLKIVVTTDSVDLKNRLSACYIVQDLDENPKPQTRRGKLKVDAKRQKSTMTKPLLGVVDNSNIAMFVDNWLSEAVREMKEACQR